MRRPIRFASVLIAPALVGLLATSAAAQNFLAVSEIVGGNGQGQVQIFQQNADGSINTGVSPVVVSDPAMTYVYGMAYNSSTNDLYIASLGADKVFDYNTISHSLTVAIDLSGTGHYQPNDLAFTGGNLYVSMYDSGTMAKPGAVLEYQLSGGSFSQVNSFIGSGNGLQGPTGLAVNGSTVYVNSSQTGQLYALPAGGPSPFTLPGSLLSAPAGMTFATIAGHTVLVETNFFNAATGSTFPEGLASYRFDPSVTFQHSTTGSYSNTFASGGPADAVIGPGTDGSGHTQLLVSNYGDNKIYQYGLTDGGAFITGPTPYLSLGAGDLPTYLLDFDPPAPAPEPSSVALLALGVVAGLATRRRLRRAKAAG